MSKRIRKKKAVIVTLAATLALTAALPAGVYAEAVQVGEGSSSAGGSASNAPVKGESPVDAKVTKEKAVSLSRKYASIPDDYVLQNASYTTETLARGKRTQWHLSFVKRVNNKFIGEISTRIDAANGNLLGFHTYVNDPTRKAVYPPKVSREQAKELALKFIAQVNPQYKDQLLYNEDYGAQFRPPLNEEVRYAIRYNRVVNDIAYMDNYIDIEMDGEGHVYQFNVKWDETIEFEQSKPGITAEEALQQFRKEAELELIYTIPYEMTKKREPMLRYEMQPFMLDAVKGGRWIGFAEPASPIALKPVSEEPLGEKPEEGKSLTAEQAAELVIEAFSVDKEAVLRDSSYSEYTDPATGKTSASWNIGWEIKGGDENTRSVWASVNSDTGEIRHYSAYTDWRNTEQGEGVTYEQAKAKALDLLKKQLPGYTHELYFADDASRYEGKKPEEFREYGFQFQRRVNGARTEYENVHININALTGDVQNYYGELSGFEYPAKAPKIIDREEALDAIMEYYKVELTYMLPSFWKGEPIPLEKYNLLVAAGEIPPGTPMNDADNAKAKLVYRLVPRPLDEAVFLDAVSGVWRERSTGEETELIKPQATDIDGHWAARELSLMVAYKALDLEDGKVRPKAIVTRGELIKMLVLAMNSGRRPMRYAEQAKASFNDVAADSAYFVYVESAVEQNLIDRGDGSFDPEGKVDREEMAELIVRALGYNTLAEYDDLFNLPFKDAESIEKKGQAAIVAGLKIMTPDKKGNFMPNRQVTRAEASAAFFRFLRAKADLQEAPLRY